ncbi:hypothetical protein [Kitasatospora sp. NPDC059571]|uniref:hypothetical protein n=1 Tax=Kitasatospora sp. NPDC059571 TaxID=3346871 RepID=UPI00367DB82D
MTDDAAHAAVTADDWQRLATAHAAYHEGAGGAYDEVLREVAARVAAEGSIGKADIGALVLWKRLRADTPWAYALMSLPDTAVRAVTAEAVAAVRDTALDRGTAARRGRAALSPLPGFDRGDALASALLTAAAPDRMAVYDRRAHRGLDLLGLELDHRRGRYGRYMALLDRLLAAAPAPVRGWTARDLDTALYGLVPSA